MSYGDFPIPSSTDIAHAGIIKLQRMQPVFPEAGRKYNILYMVSSRMPQDAVRLASWAHAKRAKVVWNQNGVAYPAWHGAGWERTNAPMAALLHAADHVFYQSRFCKDSADRYLGSPRCPSEILYNAVDTKVFCPRRQSPSPSNSLTLLLGGSQDQFYRLETGLRALERVARVRPDVRMLVTGCLRWLPDEREAKKVARELIDRLGLADRVVFTGPFTQHDAPALFNQAHVLLHTKYNDPSPGVVVEAMACGLPVVYSRSGGLAELVGDDAGIGVPTEISWDRDIPPDPDLLGRAVLEVAERLPPFSDAARQRAVDNFDLQPWLRRHGEVFEALVRC